MRFCVTVLVVIAALPAAPACGDDPEAQAVMAKLSVVLREMRDVTADIAVHTPSRQASGSIVLQYVKRSSDESHQEAPFIRKYIVATRLKTKAGLLKIRQVNDGAFLWVEQTNVKTGVVRVVRREVKGGGPVPGGLGLDWRREIDQWRRKYVFSVLRRDTVYGEPVVVMEGTAKLL